MGEVKNRSLYIDVLKGIGAMAVVFGHAGGVFSVFGKSFYWGGIAYTFHLPIFFFCTGYLLKDFDIQRPWEAMTRRLRSIWLPFVMYSITYISLRNLFVNIGILDAELYTKRSFLQAIAAAVVLRGPDGFLGTFWFVPVLLLTTGAVLAWMHITDKWKCSGILRLLGAIISGIFGMLLHIEELGLEYHMQTVFMMFPIVLAGFYFRKYEAVITRYLNIVIGFICAVFIYYLQKETGKYIELSSFQIMTPFWYYPIIFMGLYFCLSLGKFIIREQTLTRVIAPIGLYSFDIMALQFLVFKSIDYCYVFMGMGDMAILKKFPFSFPELWWIYLLGGVSIPILFRKIFNQMCGSTRGLH